LFLLGFPSDGYFLKDFLVEDSPRPHHGEKKKDTLKIASFADISPRLGSIDTYQRKAQ